MEAAVAGQSCDMLGLARPAILNPNLPRSIVFNDEVADKDATLHRATIPIPWWLRWLGIRAVGAGVENVSSCGGVPGRTCG